VDKPLRPMANRSCGCFVWALAPFLFVWCFAVCFAVFSGETQVWLGDLRVVVFGWFWCLCVFLIDLPAQMDMMCPCTKAFLASAHVRTEPLARHRPHSRKKNQIASDPQKRKRSMCAVFAAHGRPGVPQAVPLERASVTHCSAACPQRFCKQICDALA